MRRLGATVGDDPADSGLARVALSEGSGTPRPIALAISALVGLAVLASILTVLVLEIQAGASAYVVGERHWSRAQQDAVRYLQIYAIEGRREDLALAREALEVPLGDHAARLALDRPTPDMDAARAGFLQGRNASNDVWRLVWMYRLFADAPYFRDAIVIWREADRHILRLRALADELETARASGAVPAELTRELITLDAVLRPLEENFSVTLVRGSRWLHRLLMIASVVALAIMGWLAVMVLRWTLRRIRESEGQFRAAFRQSSVGMAKLAPDGSFIEVNDALCTIFGMSETTLLGMKLGDVLDPDDPLRALLDGGDAACWSAFERPGDLRFLRHDGTPLWLRWTATLIRGRERARVFAIVEDVSEARRLADEVAHQASHDALTGLCNRREIERRLALSLAEVRRGGVQRVLCFIDLDQFKVVNDTCGHLVGDRLLRRVASELSMQLRAGDVIGRLGGDEFAVILQTNLEGAQHAARKLGAALSGFTFQEREHRFTLTGSIGLVEITADAPDETWVLSAADTACYLAKQDGRNCVRIYVESDVAIARRRSELELLADVRLAISERRLRLYAQRIQPLPGDGRGGDGVGEGALRYELLLRFVDANGSLHPPAACLAAAERHGQAGALDRHVIGLALSTLAQHPEHVAQLDRCHVNLSAQSLSDPSFRHWLEALLDRGTVPCDKLCFELTETAAITHLAPARQFIDMLRSRGCEVALDDFGSGLSSFGYLKNLPVDVLKIDQIFVRDLADDLLDLALVRAICEIARTLGKQTVAEGVESTRALAALAGVGVDFVQGYAIHAPCPLEQLIEQHRSGRRAFDAVTRDA